MTLNEEQKRIIDADLSKNMLVSAAAGSGKTTVLTERIVNILSDISLSDILIMTFTRKATSEMSSRIRKKLNERLKTTEGDLRRKLARELAIVQNANIYTIDAFCKRIVDENYTLLDENNSLYNGFDPNYRIADSNEMAVLKEDVLNDLLEEKYIDEKYFDLFDSYIEKSNENPIRNLLNKGIDNLSSIPWPCDFLSDIIDNFKEYSKKAYDEYKKSDAEKEADDRLVYNNNDLLYMELLKEYYLKILNEKKRRNVYEINDYAHISLDILYDKDKNSNENYGRVISNRAKNASDSFKCIFIDEYQDTNFLQEKILSAISDNFRNNNVFMVGDVKQSIYKFRHAEPTIFVDKFNEYKNNSSLGMPMTLSVNYRSSKEVIEYVNDLFSKAMTLKYGNIDYNDNNALVPKEDEKKRDFVPEKKVEIKVICKPENETIKHPGDFYEANYVADEIENLVKHKNYKYNQIVILMRSTKNKAKTFIDVLSSRKIPVYAEEKTGFFNKLEIKLMIEILSVIDNPTQNLPLASVLLSDIYSLSDNELSFIKLIELNGTNIVIKNASKETLDSISHDKNKNPNFNLYKALLYIRRIYEEPETVSKEEIDNFNAKFEKYGIGEKDFESKIKKFFSDLDDAKFKARYMKISDLIDYIYEKYRIKDIVSVMPDGERRLANLDILYDFAVKFESSSSIGLFNFNRYIEKIMSIDADQGQAKISDENANTVRIMTIHSAKGLEFDTVFLCGANQKYRMDDSDVKSPLQFDKDYGFALDYYDLEKRMIVNTPKKELLRKRKEDESKQEELRVLYVALTRAINKLYIVGNVLKNNRFQGVSLKKLDEWLKGFESGEHNDVDIKECNSYFDVMLKNLSALDNLYCNFEKIVYTIKENKTKEIDFNLSEISSDNLSDLNIDLEDTYQYKAYQDLTPKFSVSALKEAGKKETSQNTVGGAPERNDKVPLGCYASPLYDDNDDVYEDKRLADSEELSGAELGTAYHRFMEYYDYTNPSEPARIRRGEHCEPVIPEDKLSAFLSTNLGKEMKQAHDDHKLHREQKFMKLFSKNEIDALMNRMGSARAQRQSAPGASVLNDQCIVIQGIIDAFYIKKDSDGNDYIVLVDYKTDSINRKITDENKFSKELIDRYKIQLDAYAKVLEDLTGYEVREKYIYSFAIDKEIAL